MTTLIHSPAFWISCIAAYFAVGYVWSIFEALPDKPRMDGGDVLAVTFFWGLRLLYVTALATRDYVSWIALLPHRAAARWYDRLKNPPPAPKGAFDSGRVCGCGNPSYSRERYHDGPWLCSDCKRRTVVQ